MKTLLPILKTKLVLLSFLSACTIILATTVPQIRNFIAPEKAIGEKVTTEQKKIVPNNKKQNKTVNVSRVTSGVVLGMNNSFDATLTSDALDYAPGNTAILTGSGFTPGETVTVQVLHADYQPGDPIGDDHLPWYVVADENGNFVTTWHVCEDDCVGETLRATADGQTSLQHAEVLFTDADGSGTTTISPQEVCAGSMNNSFTISFRSASGGPGTYGAGSNAQITIPAGWTTPQISNASDPGYISVASVGTATVGTPVISGTGPWFITFAFTCSNTNANGFDLTYGGGGTMVTAHSTAGPYTFLTQTDQGTGDVFANTGGNQTVDVNALPNATITTATSVCANSIENTASVPNAGGGATYVWSIINGTITSGAGTRNIEYTAGASGSVTLAVTVTNSDNCQASSGNLLVTINPLPALYNVTFTGSLCGTATINLSGSETGVNYQLYKGNATEGAPVAGTGSSLSFGDFSANGLYTVLATNATTDCEKLMTGSVDVGNGTEPILYNVTGGGSYCTGGVGLPVGLDDTETGVDYQLYLGVNPVVGSLVAGTGSAISFGNQTAAGTYTVVGTKTSGNCTSTMTGSVDITLKTFSVAPSSAVSDVDNFCADAGGNIQLTASGGSLGTGAVVRWYTSSCGGVSVGEGNPLIINKPTTTTTYYARYEGDCNTTDCASVVVSVKTLSVAPASAVSDVDNFCSDAGGNIELTASGGTLGTGAIVKWYTGSCGFTEIGTGSSLTISKPTTTTTYYARYEGDCNSTTCASVLVTVKTLSAAPTSAVSDVNNFCSDAGGNIQLTASGGSLGTGAVVKWYTSSCGGTLVNTGNPLSIAKPTTTTTYYARYEGDCNTTDCASTTVTVKQKSASPSSATATPSSTICVGGSASLNLVGGGGGDNETIVWYTSSCGGTQVGTGNALSVSPTTTTTYYGRYENGAPCNFNTTCAEVTVTVNTITGGVIAKGGLNPGPGCGDLNPNITMNTTSATGAGTITYTWLQSTDNSDWDPAEGTPNADASQFNPSEFTVTTYFKRVATSTLNTVQCTAESNVLEYIVNPVPIVASTLPGGTLNICVSGTVQLTNATPDGVWGTTTPLLVSVSPTGLVTGLAPGAATVTYTVTNEFDCSTTRNRTVNVFANPVVTAINTCIGNSNITFTQTGGAAGGTWSVSGGGTINASTGEFNETTAGCFTVTYTTPAPGCFDTKSFYVSPIPPPAPTVPNVCNTNLVATGVTVGGFTTEYKFDDGTFSTSNTSPNATPGCHTVQVRFVLANTCGETAAGTPVLCGLSPVTSAVIFPAAPVIEAPDNTCSSMFTLPEVDAVSGFNIQYKIDAGSWEANPSTTTPGCHTVKARYVLAAVCGDDAIGATAPIACIESNEVSVVIFPAAPTVAAISNTCNSKLANITDVTPVTGFTAQYAVKTPVGGYSSFGTLAEANALLANTPGCWSVKARYKLTSACGETGANATSTDACGESAEVKAVVFPGPPLITAPANTCNGAFILPTVSPIVGFGVEYLINYVGGWSATPTVPTTPGCYTIHAKYVLSQTCGSTYAGSDGPLPPCEEEYEEDCPAVIGGCTVSMPVSVVIFPAAPSAPVVSNTCNAALTIPALNAVGQFTAEYSFNNGTNWSTSNISVLTTPGCYSMKTRYVLTSPCAIGVNTTAPAACAASATGNAVIFPAKPSAPVVSNTCDAALTIPALNDVTGFTRQYSFDGTTWGTSNVSSTTPGCYTLKSRYIWTGTCGTIAVNTEAPCGSSDASNAVIFPAAPTVASINNTCNAKLANITDVTPVASFTAEYAVKSPVGSYSSFGTLAEANALLANTPGCWSVKARYKLTTACGSTDAGATSSGACGESAEVSAVVFPTAPAAPTVNGTCGPIIVTPPASVTGFNIEYSFNDGVSWGPNTPPTADNCAGYKIRTRYVLASTCGSTIAGTAGTGTCEMSAATTRIVDNTAPIVSGTVYTGTTGTNACKANAETAAPFNATLAKQGYSDNCSATVTAIKTGCSVTGTDCNWTATYTFKVVDGCGNEFPGQTYSNTGSDQTPPNAICKNISVTLGSGGSVNIAAADVNNGSNDGCGGTVGLGLDKYTFTDAEVGTGICSAAFTVKLTATDACNNTATCNATVTVGKRPTKLVYSGVVTGQYSDPVNVKATLYDMTGGEPGVVIAGKTIKFTIGSQNVTAVTDANGLASASITLNQSPTPTYNVVSCYVADGPYCGSTDTDAFDILCEDARAYYTGVCYASTSSPTSSTGIVTLSATIKDITAVLGDPAYDAYPGDITLATVTFINRDNNTAIATVPIGIVNVGNNTVGTATHNWTVNIGNTNSATYTIGIIVNTNYYCRNSSEDNTVVTVAKPLGDLFITGGGYLVLTSSAGIKAGDVGTRNNFGFNVKYNNSQTNLQGHMNTIIRRLEGGVMKVYQVKANVMTSLVVNTNCPKSATFNGKANIQDITNPALPVSVDGNATLQVKMTDLGEPGACDKIAITVWNKYGGLWFASNWDGTATVQQVLAGGNLKVHGGAACPTTNCTPNTRIVDNSITKSAQMEVIPEVSLFNVKAFPNPSGDQFSLYLEGANNDRVSITVYDAMGREVKKFEKENGNIPIRFGKDLKGGLYIVEVKQGDNRKTLKLVKQ